MKEYSERLVSKLETKNVELARAKEHLEETNRAAYRAKPKNWNGRGRELQEINRGLGQSGAAAHQGT